MPEIDTESKWDSMTRLEGDAPLLRGASMETTDNRCPNDGVKLIRYAGDNSGVELCMGCRARWLVR